jgi:hypothetical protein
MKKIHIFLSAIFATLCFASCESVLDKTDLNQISPAFVMSDTLTVDAVLNNIYKNNLPTWGNPTTISGVGGASFTDESFTPGTFTNVFLAGTMDETGMADYGVANAANNTYGYIRQINSFLQDVKTADIPLANRNRFRGQAFFFRAWRYFELVKLYGGVPLILEPQDAVGTDAKNAALLPRNSTTECLNQIVADLDSAAAYLPAKWWTTASNWGRITSTAATAYKGRVLLYAASPQFNPNGVASKWQTAYNANKAAYDLLVKNGAALVTDYGKVWFTEVGNTEAIMVTGYNNDANSSSAIRKSNGWDASTRPKYAGGSGSNQPSWEMVKAYPMKDGKKPGDATSKYTYSDQLFYKNRDPRLDKTIAYNGSTWPMSNVPNNRLWTYQVSAKTVENANVTPSVQGFYCRKALQTSDVASSTLDVANVAYSGTDWIEIRFAEVILNYAESAAAIGNVEEAVSLVAQVRKRAGIEAGTDARYGIKAGITQSEMITLILEERQVEFAFEGKRFWDLRRHRLLESTFNNQKGTKVVISIKTGKTAPTAADLTGAIDDVYNNFFTVTLTPNAYMGGAYGYNSKYYFFAIPKAAVENNALLQQNVGWTNGTFDPLQ